LLRNLETADTIEGNFKGKLCNRKYGYNCFADDTGLEVEALNGAGVFSARYAGGAVLLTTWINLQVLSNQSNRNAQNGSYPQS
jgi:XTP/dITP diphosphohydrolase